VIYKESVPEGKRLTVNSMYKCWKGYWSVFWDRCHNFKGKAMGTFCKTMSTLLW